jgi:hypothetical protein
MRGVDGVSDVGRVRVRVPSTVKPGEVVRVRAIVMHPMERTERDAQGRLVSRAYNYINRAVVTYLGKTIVSFDTTQSVSENPQFTVAFRATQPGPVRVVFTDTAGGRYEGSADIRFA